MVESVACAKQKRGPVRSVWTIAGARLCNMPWMPFQAEYAAKKDGESFGVLTLLLWRPLMMTIKSLFRKLLRPKSSARPLRRTVLELECLGERLLLSVSAVWNPLG